MKSRGALIGGLVVLLSAVAGWMPLVKPPREDVTKVEAQIQTQQDALIAARATLQTAQAAKAQYRAAYAEIVKLGKAVPADDDLQSLLVQLSATARSRKVDFLALERANEGGTGAVATGAGQTTQSPLPPGATVGASAFPVVPLKLTFRGRYFALTGFLQQLNDYVRAGNALRVRGRLLTVDGFTLSTDDGAAAGRDRTLTATVTATAYLVAPDEGATAGATAAGPAATPPGNTVADPATTTAPSPSAG